MDKSFPMISYAAVVKNSLKDKSSEDVQKTWYDQILYEQSMNRSNSLLTISSDDTSANCQSASIINRHSIQHSIDSGGVSDLSSDNEICTKLLSKSDGTILQQIMRKQKSQLQFHRQTSADSCYTSSSGCSDQNCSSNQNQVSDICKRWTNLHKVKKIDVERDEGTLARRQKQIDYGKCTIGYSLYCEQVPRENRTNDHPRTPDKHQIYSRRAFDGLIRIWRKKLHKYDPNNSADTE